MKIHPRPLDFAAGKPAGAAQLPAETGKLVDFHGRGVGRILMRAVEDALTAEHARLLLIETASKPSYDATRRFYLAWGCRECARVPDFYAVGDDKIVYARELGGAR